VKTNTLDPNVVLQSPNTSSNIDDDMDQHSSASDSVDSDHDSSYIPDSSDCSSASDTSEHVDTGDRKFIAFESSILELCGLVCCSECRNPMMITNTSYVGSTLRLEFTCPNSHEYVWRAQPMVNKMALGNLMLSAAIVFSGNTYSRFRQMADYVNLGFPNESTYRSVANKYVYPVVNEAWLAEKRVVVNSLQGRSLAITGDGRCDSPGFSAKYGTYTVMEMNSRKIVEFVVVHVKQAGNSVGMEKFGLIECLDNVKNAGLTVTTLATDRHVQITCYMRKEQPQIEHQYDVWHMSKWLSKKFSAVGKKVKCVSVAKWSMSVCNHLWWASATCDGNPDVLVEKFVSIIHHVCNVHVFPGRYVTSCSHHVNHIVN
jgi:hypothetical protein